MKDFLKIFVGVSMLAAAFVVGKNYGEKSFYKSDEFKNIAIAKDELEFSKGEVENIKAKLQNVVDRGENKKTEELLGELMQVFLADLGLQIVNKDLILQKAEMCTKAQAQVEKLQTQKAAAEAKAEAAKAAAIAEKAIEKIKQEETKVSAGQKMTLGKFKSNEFLVTNSSGYGDTKRNLDKVVIKNLNSFLSQTTTETEKCDSFLGEFKGKVEGSTNHSMGSIIFTLKQAAAQGALLDPKNLRGEIAWLNSPNPPLAQKINESCGLKARDLSGRIFHLTDKLYAQIYQVQGTTKLAGNLYEVMPGGTTNRLGKFVIDRTDKF